MYIRMKVKNATECGMQADHIKLPSSISEREVRHLGAHLCNSMFFLTNTGKISCISHEKSMVCEWGVPSIDRASYYVLGLFF